MGCHQVAEELVPRDQQGTVRTLLHEEHAPKGKEKVEKQKGGEQGFYSQLKARKKLPRSPTSSFVGALSRKE